MSVSMRVKNGEMWLVVEFWANDDIECEVDEGDALEVLNRHDHNLNDVSLIPLDKVLKALESSKDKIRSCGGEGSEGGAR